MQRRPRAATTHADQPEKFVFVYNIAFFKWLSRLIDFKWFLFCICMRNTEIETKAPLLLVRPYMKELCKLL